MEKRRFSRVPLRIEAYISCRALALKAEVENLSLNGIFLRCQEDFMVGDVARITLYLSGTVRRLDLSICMHGQVLRSGGGVVALQFQEMDLDSFTQLRNIIAYNTGDADRIRDEFIHSTSAGNAEVRKAV